jgi:hypothetical protein
MHAIDGQSYLIDITEAYRVPIPRYEWKFVPGDWKIAPGYSQQENAYFTIYM